MDEERIPPTDLGGVIKICAVEITDAKQVTVSSPSSSLSSVCGKETIAKQKIPPQNRCILLDDDKDKQEPRGVQSELGTPPLPILSLERFAVVV